MYINFVGAVSGSLTGSCTWLYHEETKVQLLVDCGMYQGETDSDWKNKEDFPFKPAEIKYVLLTHAHLDHCGLIPKLYNEGFKGKVITTEATAELALLIMEDAARIGNVYKSQDVRKVNFSYIDRVDGNRNNAQRISENISVTFLRNSHILGAASIQVSWYSEGNQPKSILFSGDVGCNFRDSEYLPLLKANHKPHPLTNYIVIEATYGDRNRDKKYTDEKNRINALISILGETVLKKRGRLIIPAFSLHRTQEIVFDFFNILTSQLQKSEYSEFLGDQILNEKNSYYYWENRIKVDCISPLATKVSSIYSKHLSIKVNSTKQGISKSKNKYLNSLASSNLNKYKISEVYNKRFISGGHVIVQKKEISESYDVAIASSGMGDAGAIRELIKESIGDKNNVILLTGYVAVNSLCGELKSRADTDCKGETIIIDGNEYKFNASIVDLSSYYSAHADADMLIDYIFLIGSVNKNHSKLVDTKIFINHGNDSSKEVLRDKIELRSKKKNLGERLISDIYIAAKSNWYNLDKSCYEDTFELHSKKNDCNVSYLESLISELIDIQKKTSNDIEQIKKIICKQQG